VPGGGWGVPADSPSERRRANPQPPPSRSQQGLCKVKIKIEVKIKIKSQSLTGACGGPQGWRITAHVNGLCRLSGGAPE